jgi:hypothetical protein
MTEKCETQDGRSGTAVQFETASQRNKEGFRLAMRPENPRFVLEAIEALRDERMEVRNSNFAAIKAALPNLLLFLGWLDARTNRLAPWPVKGRQCLLLRTAFSSGGRSFDLTLKNREIGCLATVLFSLFPQLFAHESDSGLALQKTACEKGRLCLRRCRRAFSQFLCFALQQPRWGRPTPSKKWGS